MKRIAIICSRFNEKICEGLLSGALKALKESGIRKIDVYRVPGAYEIPFVAKKLALSKKYGGIICLGAVIKGETPHFDYISQYVSLGIGQVSLDSGVPVSFGVITTLTVKQAKDRSADNKFNKGREAALSCLEMMEMSYGKPT